MADRAVVHQQRVEDFLARAEELARFAGGAFDFVSCCPPYQAVAYPSLMPHGPLWRPERASECCPAH